MTSRFESERPFVESPTLDYLSKIKREMSNPERDTIFAISCLYEKITGENISDKLLRELVYQPGSEQLVSHDQLATYPIIVFGETMEYVFGSAWAAVEYKRAMRGVLDICQGRHDETCAAGPCLSGQESRFDRDLFCPVMDCVDFLADGVIVNDFYSTGYLVDASRQRELVEARAKALISTSPEFYRAYYRYLELYQNKMDNQSDN